ncbi:helix-turn-helix domain-containing protein, partial [Elusimicrobiota bacterium]
MIKTIDPKFGHALCKLRKSAGLKLRVFARTAKVSPAWMSYVETGKRIPTWEFVEVCAGTLKAKKIPTDKIKRFKILGQKIVFQKTFGRVS